MGDRVLFQVVNGKEIGPVVYAHWSGSKAKEIVFKLASRMANRLGDVSYTSARLVQEVCESVSDKSHSVGVWSAKSKLKAADSHGDAGIVLIDANTFECTYLGGYLVTEAA